MSCHIIMGKETMEAIAREKSPFHKMAEKYSANPKYRWSISFDGREFFCSIGYFEDGEYVWEAVGQDRNSLWTAIEHAVHLAQQHDNADIIFIA